MLRIYFNRPYIVTDFEGNILPGVFTPFKRVRSGKIEWFVCIGPAGGHIHIKRSEFVREAV
jgi:hypothetical protein